MKTMRSAILAAAISLASVASASAAGMEDWIVKPATGSVPETVARLTGAIEKAGATVFATIDHAAGAKAIGDKMDDMTLVIFGNPKIGTPIMKAAPAAGLDLPIRVLVWNDKGTTQIGYLKPEALQARYSINGADQPITMMGSALARLTDAAAGN